AQRHPADQLGEADAPAGGPAGLAEVAVDRGVGPAAGGGPLPQVILQAQALLVADHLLGGRLADVDYRPTAQMGRGDEIGAGHRAPPVEGSRRLRGWAGGLLWGVAARRIGARRA